MSGVLFYPGAGAILRSRPKHLPKKGAKCETVFARLETERSPLPKQISDGVPIFIFGEITTTLGDIAERTISEIGRTGKPLSLWINSSGGEVEAGLKIIDALKKIKSRKIVVVIGEAYSMAAIMATLGSRGHRYIFKEAAFMLHEVGYDEDISGTAREIDEAAQDLGGSTDNFYKLLAKVSNNKIEKLRKAFRGVDRYYSPEAAVRSGFMDWVIGHPLLKYDGVANPSSPVAESYKNPLEIPKRKTLLSPQIKFRPSKETSNIFLNGDLDTMTSYKIMLKMIAYISTRPERDIRLIIRNSQDGETQAGFALFSLMRLINSLRNCGDVATLGSGESIKGIPALLLSAGKAGKRELSNKTEVALAEPEIHVPAPRRSMADELSNYADWVKETLLQSIGCHSDFGLAGVDKMIEMGQKENEGLVLTAEEARQRKLVDRVR
jgi:ATP-dependent Clp protease protease subunit